MPYIQMVSVRRESSTMRVVADISLVTLIPEKLKKAIDIMEPHMANWMLELLENCMGIQRHKDTWSVKTRARVCLCCVCARVFARVCVPLVLTCAKASLTFSNFPPARGPGTSQKIMHRVAINPK
jgi:hypothetical protein